MNAEFPYKRLPGRLSGWVRKASLWEGTDHVLLVRGTRFQEEYRRFAYRDIQSLQMARTFRWGSVGWLVFNGMFCVIWLAAALGRNNWGSWAIFSALLGLLVTQLTRCVYWGCRCYVQTAVSREELPSLIRRGAAEKTFERLRARIGEAQGELPSDLSALVDAAEVTDAGIISSLARPVADNARAAVRSVNLAVIAFGLFLLDAAETYPELEGGPSTHTHWYSSRFVTAALILSMVGTLSGSLLAGFGVRRLKGLRVWVLAALVAEVFDLYVSFFLRSLFTVQRGIVSMDMTQFKIWQVTAYVDELVLVVTGIGGMLFVLIKWNGLRRGDA